MRLIIAGTRTFNDYDFLQKRINHLLKDINEEIEIVSGQANGADKLGEKYAKENGFTLKRFPANWETFGKKAGYLRNKQMAEYSTHCICFWDGLSKGTKLMIELAQQYNLNLRIIKLMA